MYKTSFKNLNAELFLYFIREGEFKKSRKEIQGFKNCASKEMELIHPHAFVHRSIWIIEVSHCRPLHVGKCFIIYLKCII